VELLIRESIAYAYTQYPLLNDYIRFHAREMDEAVMRKHIELYVNAYSMSLGEVGRSAVLQLMKQFSIVHHSEAINESVFLT
jgi:1,4-dihydroxy-6-naphthoate synthase